jgi:hypothetical protein
MDITELKMSGKTTNALRRHGCQTVDDVVKLHNTHHLRTLLWIGDGVFKEVCAAIPAIDANLKKPKVEKKTVVGRICIA